ncbi:MAG: FMN-binding negative transcriptional regulator, partial [Mucilaginibacter polytrichastri]|nr:FMN-binding negative transcriptional regulator [Mucilaginibacter polytrichastri]
MYIPAHFRFTDEELLLAFMQQNAFATIISLVNGRPEATHLPFVIGRRNGELLLQAHFAKANAQWKSIGEGEALVIFIGPHAYISPQHYEKEQNVPTWNYIAVHAYGRATILPDDAQALAVLEKSIASFEPAYQQQWDQLDEGYRQKMLKGIVAFEIVVSDLQGKKKLSQNRS